MSFEVISDLHTELINSQQFDKIYKLFKGDAENLILAGDIGDPFSEFYKNFLSNISLQYKKIFIIAGNHEFYNKHTIEQTVEQINNVSKLFDNVYFLNQTLLEFENFIILGCVLWTHIIDDEQNQVTEYMNDYKFISNFTVKKQNKLHKKDVNWLKEQFIQLHYNKKPVIVVTHHLPSYKLIHTKYLKNSIINSAFANTDCDAFFEKINYWVCGHTHTPMLLDIDNCKCICNPLGYENENKNVNPYIFHCSRRI